MEIEEVIPVNILHLQPYSCAREEYDGVEAVLLDANESPYHTGYNRYPDPYQRNLKERLASLKQVKTENLLLGNGSDEIIDLLIRTVCEPRQDNVMVFSPGYAMYEVSAAINRVEVRKVALTRQFLPDWEEMWKQTDAHTKLIFLCTPHNPTGKVTPLSEIGEVCRRFKGIVVVDEAYIDFADCPSATVLLARYPRLVVMQTLSKAWGMAGLRLGICIAEKKLICILNKVKAPYNVGSLTQATACRELEQYGRFRERVEEIKAERRRMIAALKSLQLFEQVYDSEANFILVISSRCRQFYRYLVDAGVVVRLRDIPPLIGGGIRITVGTPQENDRLLEVLTKWRKDEKDFVY